ncbi:MAG TPA: phosphotransferase [Roseiflexaceae bacterium]|nr:phosphotransferase [Roseiflexaceae bacterium]
MMNQALLDAFGITAADLLGRGSESAVYALDDQHVVRVYRHPPPPDYLQRRNAFYAMLREQRLPFETPYILECGTRAGSAYCVEARMRGRDFAGAMPHLAGAGREQALRSYLDVATQIGSIVLPDAPFGEVLTHGAPVQRARWDEYVIERVSIGYEQGRAFLQADVPGVDEAYNFVVAQLAGLTDVSERRLVHGDYFPGNVFIDDSHTICGVGDFGYSTVVGDPRLDVAGALAFIEVVDGYQPHDTLFLQAEIARRFGNAIEHWLEVYRLYYSFYFSGCKADDPHTYWWCAANLRGWLERNTARNA